MREVGHFIKTWWPAITAVVALAVATLAMSQIAPLVDAGKNARTLQINTAPAQCKRYVANYRQGVWNLDDLMLVAENAPVACAEANRILSKHGISVSSPASK